MTLWQTMTDEMLMAATSIESSLNPSLIPRLSNAGAAQRAWYTLSAHAPKSPSNEGPCKFPVFSHRVLSAESAKRKVSLDCGDFIAF